MYQLKQKEENKMKGKYLILCQAETSEEVQATIMPIRFWGPVGTVCVRACVWGRHLPGRGGKLVVKVAPSLLGPEPVAEHSTNMHIDIRKGNRRH